MKSLNGSCVWIKTHQICHMQQLLGPRPRSDHRLGRGQMRLDQTRPTKANREEKKQHEARETGRERDFNVCDIKGAGTLYTSRLAIRKDQSRLYTVNFGVSIVCTHREKWVRLRVTSCQWLLVKVYAVDSMTHVSLSNDGLWSTFHTITTHLTAILIMKPGRIYFLISEIKKAIDLMGQLNQLNSQHKVYKLYFIYLTFWNTCFWLVSCSTFWSDIFLRWPLN